MTPTILLALTTSLRFGVGDFLGGVATRRDSSFAVTGTSHMLSIVLLGIAVLLMPGSHPTTADLVWGAVTGLSGVVGVTALFAGLSVGRMSIVSPIAAAMSAALPAMFDLATGTSLAPITIAGIVLVLVAIVIVSIAPDEQLHEPEHPYKPQLALGLALLSGVGFSGGFIAMSFTSEASGITPLLAARVVSIAVAAVMAMRVGNGFPVNRAALLPTLGAGLTDALASVTVLYAIRIGPLAIASVLGSLFPVVVVFLARVFLRERLHVWQRIGVGIAVVAVLLSALR